MGGFSKSETNFDNFGLCFGLLIGLSIPMNRTSKDSNGLSFFFFSLHSDGLSEVKVQGKIHSDGLSEVKVQGKKFDI